MDGNFNMVQRLLEEKADYQARLKLIPYDGSPEVKENSSGRGYRIFIREQKNIELTQL